MPGFFRLQSGTQPDPDAWAADVPGVGPMIRAILLGLVLFLFGAGTASANPSCTPTSAGIAFGNLTGSPITITGSITLTCTGTGKDNYNLDLSTGSSGSFTTR